MKKFFMIVISALVLFTFQISPCLALNTYDLGKVEISTQADAVNVLKGILSKKQPGIYQLEMAEPDALNYNVEQLKDQAFWALPPGNVTFFTEGSYYQGKKLVLRVDSATLRADNPAQYGAIINKAKTGKLKNFSVLITNQLNGSYNLSAQMNWTWHRTKQNIGAQGMLVTFKVPSSPLNKATGNYSAANYAQLKNVLNSSLKSLYGTIKVRIPASIDTKAVSRAMADLEDESLYIEYVTVWRCSIYKNTLTMNFTYPYDYTTMKQLQTKTEAKAVQVIAAVIKPGMTDYQKVLAINDYITANTYYDKNDLYLGVNDEYNQLAAGPLLRGKAVCGGYSRAANYLLRKTGIPSLVVSGTANNGLSVEDHAWNIVRLNNGKYYNLDTTWNDSDDTPGYPYFLVDDKTLSRNHTWDTKLYPKCTDASLTYYKVNNLLVEDPETFLQLVRKTLEKKENNLAFISQNFNETWINQAFHIIRDFGLRRTISYSIDPATNLVSISFQEESAN